MQTPSSSPRDLGQVLVLVRWLLILLFIVLGWVVLAHLAHVLAPILAALGIAYLLNPVVAWLGGRGLSRTAATGLVLVGFLAVITTTIVVVAPAITDQVSDFARDLPQFVDNLGTWAHDRFGLEIPRDWKQYLTSDEARSALGDASGPLRQLAAAALGGVFSVLAVLAEMLLVPVFAFYFLADWPNLWRRLEHMVPPRRRATVR
ncbi:MAG TPA: AI-2E family transporter, partial [Kofleriaceae bacterium]|nr:AI-2E family transporter [Kofleriaceae bacterium]